MNGFINKKDLAHYLSGEWQRANMRHDLEVADKGADADYWHGRMNECRDIATAFDIVIDEGIPKGE